MSKYIKRVNWPWVEIETDFRDSPTMTLNTDYIAVVWPYPNGVYTSGIRLRDGKWIEDPFSEGALKELQDLLMNRKIVKVSSPSPGYLGTEVEIETMHEDQTMQEWLEEEGQA